MPVRRISTIKPGGTAQDACVKFTFILLSFKATPSADTILAIECRKSGPHLRRFRFGPQGLRKFFDLFGFFDNVHRKDLDGRSFLELVAQIGGELIEALDALAKFFFVFQKACSLCGRGFARLGINLGGVWRVSRLGLGGRRGRILRAECSPRPCESAGQQGGAQEKVSAVLAHSSLREGFGGLPFSVLSQPTMKSLFVVLPPGEEQEQNPGSEAQEKQAAKDAKE